jgi:hypothetical protein
VVDVSMVPMLTCGFVRSNFAFALRLLLDCTTPVALAFVLGFTGYLPVLTRLSFVDDSAQVKQTARRRAGACFARAVFLI